MRNENTLEAAKSAMIWWNAYYHLLLGFHYALGLLGVVCGALIAANLDSYWFGLTQPILGVISTVIVGVVSFVQPGRMASIFFEAYWRMRVAILRYQEEPEKVEELLDSIALGFATVATLQPEALKKPMDHTALDDAFKDGRAKRKKASSQDDTPIPESKTKL